MTGNEYKNLLYYKSKPNSKAQVTSTLKSNYNSSTSKSRGDAYSSITGHKKTQSVAITKHPMSVSRSKPKIN